MGTILVYWVSKVLYHKYKLVVLSPLIIVPLVLIILLVQTRISYTDYVGGAKWLTMMLGPATVAMAIPLYKNFKILKRYALEILTSIFIGSTLAIISSMILSSMLKFNQQIVISIAPRSVTTPIAIDISKIIGGVQTLTAVFVLLTGLVGLIVGPLIIKVLRIQSSAAKGVLLGLGAHGCGISKAIELGSEEGSIASLAMLIAAGITTALAPVIVPVISHYI